MRHVFTETQMAVLLALSGMEGIYLFPIADGADDRSLLSAAVRLCSMGAVVESPGGLVPSEPLAGMIEAMGRAGYALKLGFYHGPFPRQLIYPAGGGGVVVVERERRPGEGVVKLQDMDIRDYLYELEANDMLPEDSGVPEEMEELEKKARDELVDGLASGELLLRLQRINTRTGDEERRVDLVSSDIFKWLHFRGGGGESCRLYSRGELGQILLNELRR